MSHLMGSLLLEKRHLPTGKIQVVALGSNVIVRGCRAAICRLIAGDDEANNVITQMQFGTGSLAETATDTALQSPITPVKGVDLFEYPGYPGWGYTDRCRFTAYLLADEANGFPISEAGLLTVAGRLCARKTFTAQNKTADYIFTFRWIIRSG